MSNERRVTLNTEVEKCIRAIGEDLINRAEEISRDLERVSSIDISASIKAGELVHYNVNKDYTTHAFIDYHAIREARNDVSDD